MTAIPESPPAPLHASQRPPVWVCHEEEGGPYWVLDLRPTEEAREINEIALTRGKGGEWLCSIQLPAFRRELLCFPASESASAARLSAVRGAIASLEAKHRASGSALQTLRSVEP